MKNLFKISDLKIREKKTVITLGFPFDDYENYNPKKLNISVSLFLPKIKNFDKTWHARWGKAFGSVTIEALSEMIKPEELEGCKTSSDVYNALIKYFCTSDFEYRNRYCNQKTKVFSLCQKAIESSFGKSDAIKIDRIYFKDFLLFTEKEVA